MCPKKIACKDNTLQAIGYEYFKKPTAWSKIQNAC